MARNPFKPRYMESRKVRSGDRVIICFYWNPPSWARKQGCPIAFENLGSDRASAIPRAEYLNAAFDEWRLKRDGERSGVMAPARVGSVDWLIAEYQNSPRYKKLKANSRKDADTMLSIVAGHRRKSGKRFGEFMLPQITPGLADKLHHRILTRTEGDGEAQGKPRGRTARQCMVIMRTAWATVRRSHPQLVPDDNPFAGMDLTYQKREVRPATYQDVDRFIHQAIDDGFPEMAAAAVAGFYFLQRVNDIVGNFVWADYVPGRSITILHDKRHERVTLDLVDQDGTPLYADAEWALAQVPKRGPLIVMQAEGAGRPARPYTRHLLAKRFKRIRDRAGMHPDLQFKSFRHGGITEAVDAGVKDRQLQAVSRHQDSGSLKPYSHRTAEQARETARLRRDKRASLRLVDG